MATTTTPSTDPSHESLFHAIDAYPWTQDAEFQAGLSAIVGANTDPRQVERLSLRARCFYYARKNNVSVDFPAYQAWHDARQAETNAAGHPVKAQMRPTDVTLAAVEGQTEELPPYPMSFQDIVELISSGAPIPGIKDIPDTLLEDQGTTSTKPKRRKPWETDSTAPSS